MILKKQDGKYKLFKKESESEKEPDEKSEEKDQPDNEALQDLIDNISSALDKAKNLLKE